MKRMRLVGLTAAVVVLLWAASLSPLSALPPPPNALDLSATTCLFGTVVLTASGAYGGYSPPASVGQGQQAGTNNGDGTVSCTITVTNLGSGALTSLAAVLQGGGPFLASQLASTTLGAGASEQLTLTYTAVSGSSALQTGSMTVSASGAPSVTVTLKGETNTQPQTPATPTITGDATTLMPTFTGSAYYDADSDAYAGAQWTVNQVGSGGSETTIYTTSVMNATTGIFTPAWIAGPADGGGSTPTFTMPGGVLAYGSTYRVYVSYRDARGAASLVSPYGQFMTQAQPQGLSAYGVPLAATTVTDGSGKAYGAITAALAATLAGDSAVVSVLPQIAAVEAALNQGAASSFTPVKTNGGTGSQAVAIGVNGANGIVSVRPINTSGQSVSDSAGDLSQVTNIQMPSGITVPYGFFAITLQLAAGQTQATVTIVPPVPFPSGTQWYKVNTSNGAVSAFPYFQVDGSGNGILTLTDNGAGDSDPRAGYIKDPGAPVVVAQVTPGGGGGGGGSATPAAASGGGGGGGGGGCFIATAAFGSYGHPYVRILRDFRDRILLMTSMGSRLVDFYYRVSPPLADFIRDRDVLKACVRVSLIPAVGMSMLFLKVGLLPALMLLALSGLACVAAARRLLR